MHLLEKQNESNHVTKELLSFHVGSVLNDTFGIHICS